MIKEISKVLGRLYWQGKCDSLKERTQDLENEVTRLRNKCNDLEREKKGFEDSYHSLKEEYFELNNRKEALIAQGVQAQKTIVGLEEKVKTLSDINEQYEEKNGTLQSQIISLKGRIGGLTSLANRLKGKLNQE